MRHRTRARGAGGRAGGGARLRQLAQVEVHLQRAADLRLAQRVHARMQRGLPRAAPGALRSAASRHAHAASLAARPQPGPCRASRLRSVLALKQSFSLAQSRTFANRPVALRPARGQWACCGTPASACPRTSWCHQSSRCLLRRPQQLPAAAAGMIRSAVRRVHSTVWCRASPSMSTHRGRSADSKGTTVTRAGRTSACARTCWSAERSSSSSAAAAARPPRSASPPTSATSLSSRAAFARSSAPGAPAPSGGAAASCACAARACARQTHQELAALRDAEQSLAKAAGPIPARASAGVRGYV